MNLTMSPRPYAAPEWAKNEFIRYRQAHAGLLFREFPLEGFRVGWYILESYNYAFALNGTHLGKSEK